MAQLQYYRAEKSNSTGKPSVVPATDDTSRRAAIVTGKSDRRGHRRSSVFERVSKGVFQDMNVQDRSQSLLEPPREMEDIRSSAPRRNTTV